MTIDDLRTLDDPEPFIADQRLREAARVRGRALTRRRQLRVGTVATLLSVVVLFVGFGGYQKWRTSQVVRVDLAANLDPRGVVTPDPGQDPPPAPSEAINILVVGSDAAMPGEGREQVTDVRTDTMMVVRADPDTGSVSVLSLPRDLWVDIPGSGQERLNTAWETGGPALLIDTIKANLEIPINHFLQVDGEGFERLVDQAGGSSVWVAGELRDEKTGFAASGPGCVALDGTQALTLVRSRSLELRRADGSWTKDPAADLGRIERQQIMGRVFAASLLDQDLDVSAADQLLDTLIDNAVIDTNWGIRDMAGLLFWAQGLDLEANLTMATPPVRGGYAGQAAVLFLEEQAAEPVLARFRPAPEASDAGAEPAPGPTSGEGTATAVPNPNPPSPTTTTPTSGATPDPADWVLAAAPDGTPCR